MMFDSSRIEKKPDEDQAEQLPGEQRSDLRHAAEVAQQPVEHEVDERPEARAPNSAEEDARARRAALAERRARAP